MATLDRVKRIWYLSPMRAAKVQASLRIRAVSPEPPLLAHTSSESRGTFRHVHVCSTGPDNYILKTCASELWYPLSNLFNLSLSTSRVPKLREETNVIQYLKRTIPQTVKIIDSLLSHCLVLYER